MAEEKLSREIDETVRELLAVKEELVRRLSPRMPVLKAAGIALLCVVGAKIAFRLARWLVSLLWEGKLLIAAVVLIVLAGKREAKKT
jgi:hypothetical protein